MNSNFNALHTTVEKHKNFLKFSLSILKTHEDIVKRTDKKYSDIRNTLGTLLNQPHSKLIPVFDETLASFKDPLQFMLDWKNVFNRALRTLDTHKKLINGEESRYKSLSRNSRGGYPWPDMGFSRILDKLTKEQAEIECSLNYFCDEFCPLGFGLRTKASLRTVEGFQGFDFSRSAYSSKASTARRNI